MTLASNNKKQIKVAFVGTSSVGKTSLLWEYKKRMKNNPSVAFVHEAARDFFKDNPTVKKRFAKDASEKIQSLMLKREKKAHMSRAKIILCDRSVIDAVVYVKSTGDLEGARELLEKVRFWLPTYYKFFLLDPTDIIYEKDKIRQEDKKVRQALHKAFLEFFQESGIPYELLSGNIKERSAKVDKVLGII
ncbi:MAG: hypothetical protein A3B44_00910 [Candidatus Levybacteria bacterium RIFCSPLOWO2_01_FULL_38_21]|nr:MAG: hypothetical protein A3B44_00910 [Candidatus Levybacteria bacterium RIFCSPLOWO2_01_FULL_38_21]